MDPILFFSTLLFTVVVVAIAMLYLRRTTRQVIVALCKSEAGAEFWLRSADILAYSGALMLVLIFGYSATAQHWIEAIRITLILTLTGVLLTVLFVAHNVWKTVAPKSGEPS